MDEHVGKPFDIDHLVGVLLRHCSAPGSVDTDVFTDFSAPAVSPSRLTIELPPALLRQADAAGIALTEALGRMSGKSALFVRMVAALGEEAAALPTPLTAAALHGFRGLAATLGARALAELTAQGERLLKADQPLPEGWSARFAEAARRDVAALARLARQLHGDAPPPAVAPSSAVPTMASLVDLLHGADMAALAAYAQLRPGLVAAHPAQVPLLDAALDRLAFDEAAALCQALHEPQVSTA